ncbi:MAG: hypothetical protein KJZ85_07650 [Rhodobacteraceae bacterium]|jgi:hypothetical protein|nr:hypothetical protein [Paracoccaceae bacterium]
MRRLAGWLLAAGLVVAAAGGAARAEAVAGAATPDFRAAVALWLADDEAAALPALAVLAAGGNAAAQMLLGLIDKAPEQQGPWLGARSREARIGLLRAPGGLSGRSWMRVAAAQGVGLAELWVELWDVAAAPDIVLRFARAGEPRAAREAGVVLAKRERRGFGEMAGDPAFPAALRPFAWAEWAGEGGGASERIAADLAALHPGDPHRGLWAAPPPPAALEDWLLSAGEALPVAAFCRAECPGSAGSCARAAYGALGNPLSLDTLGSPSETLIPAADYASSPRGRAALVRRIHLIGPGRVRMRLLAAAAETDGCFAARLEAGWARY